VFGRDCIVGCGVRSDREALELGVIEVWCGEFLDERRLVVIGCLEGESNQEV
jgi:hypothetical protein